MPRRVREAVQVAARAQWEMDLDFPEDLEALTTAARCEALEVAALDASH